MRRSSASPYFLSLFTMEGRELTDTLKLRRPVIFAKNMRMRLKLRICGDVMQSKLTINFLSLHKI